MKHFFNLLIIKNENKKNVIQQLFSIMRIAHVLVKLNFSIILIFNQFSTTHLLTGGFIQEKVICFQTMSNLCIRGETM